MRVTAIIISIAFFEGKDSEDPSVFIEKLTRYLTHKNYQREDWIEMIRNFLKGYAKDWQRPYIGTKMVWESFKNKCFNRFNTPQKIAEYMDKLYGEKKRGRYRHGGVHFEEVGTRSSFDTKHFGSTSYINNMAKFALRNPACIGEC